MTSQSLKQMQYTYYAYYVTQHIYNDVTITWAAMRIGDSIFLFPREIPVPEPLLLCFAASPLGSKWKHILYDKISLCIFNTNSIVRTDIKV